MFRIQAPLPLTVDTLTIRSANFSNQKNKAHSMNIVRTGNGDTYTYINRKRGRQVHQWDFTVSYDKSLEIKAFFRQYSSSIVRAYDHDEAVYVGYMNVNPWEAQGEGRAGGWPGDEAYGFTLQLEELV